jgi:thiamine-monophosphate kinase
MGDTANRWAMIYLGAPTATKMSFLKELHEGVKEAARKWNCILAGGDTVRAKDLSLVAAVGGEMRGRSLVRSGARPNDLLCVAGPVGDASVGLRVLESQLRLPKQKAAYFVKRFFRHEPLFRAGALLAQSKNVTSLMDLSDSVAESVQLLCEASKVGAHVEVDRIPVSKEYRSLFDSDERLLTGGEDYALLFTIHPSGFAALRRKLSFSVIGRIFPAKNELRYFLKGKPIPSPRFFEHY